MNGRTSNEELAKLGRTISNSAMNAALVENPTADWRGKLYAVGYLAAASAIAKIVRRETMEECAEIARTEKCGAHVDGAITDKVHDQACEACAIAILRKREEGE